MNQQVSTTAPDFAPPSALAFASSPLRALALIAAAIAASGCAPSALSTTRQQMAAGHYAAAHRELTALLAHPHNLSAGEVREARDDLCVIEHRIGAPSYPLAAQRRTCQIAARESGSRSAAILTAIERSMLRDAALRVEHALRHNDVVEAEDAAIEYQALPGADPVLMADWSRRMWRIVHRHVILPKAKRRPGSLRLTIARLRKRYRHVRRMSKAAFLHWVAKQGTVDGAPIYSEITLRRSVLKLAVHRSDLPAASLNLVRFTTVNDAMAARCGCDARTEVSIAETRFPLYVVTLDPAVGSSEALILPHP